MRKIISLATTALAPSALAPKALVTAALAFASVGMTGCITSAPAKRSQYLEKMPSADAKAPAGMPATHPAATHPTDSSAANGSASRAGGPNAGDTSAVQPASYTGGPHGARGARQEAPSGMKLQQPTAVQNAGVPQGSMMVMMQPLRGKATQTPVQVAGLMGVGEVLEKTKLTRKASDCEVILYRTSEEGKPQRMEVKMEKGRIMLTSDYTVHAGDRLMIIEKKESALDSAMGKFLGPVGRK